MRVHQIRRCNECRTLLRPQQIGPLCADTICAVIENRIQAREELADDQKELLPLIAEARDAALSDQSDIEGIELMHLVLPANTQPATPLARERCVAFKLHLEAIIGEAKLLDNGLDDQAQPLANSVVEPLAPTAQHMVGEACSICMGRCCNNGGTHAFLNAADIRRLTKQLAISIEALEERLLAKLKGVRAENACVFQAGDGCVLPRDHRAATCNEYLCNPVTQFVQAFPQSGASVLFLARDERGNFVRRKLVDLAGFTGE